MPSRGGPSGLCSRLLLQLHEILAQVGDRHVLRPDLAHDTSAVDDDHAVGDLVDMGEVVLYVDAGAARSLDQANEVQHLAHFRDAKRRRRLVKHDEVGLVVHRPADRDALAFAARQIGHGRIDRDAGAPEAERLLQDLMGDLLLPADVDKAEAIGDLAPDEEIAPQRLLVGQRTVLIDCLDRELVRHANRIVGGTELAVADENATRRGRQHSGHNLDQRRLAGAVVADQAHDLVAANRKIDVVQRPNRTEEFLYAFEADNILKAPLDDLDARRLAHIAPPRVPRRLRRFNRLTSPATAQQSTSNRGYRASAKRRTPIPRGRPAAADPRRAQRSSCATTERQTPPTRLAIGAYAGPN